MPNVISYGLTVIIIYYFTYFGARILSKKAISEMSGYEMVGIIIFATVAAEPLVTKITSQAILGVVILIALTILSSKLSMKNKLSPIFEHTPTIIVKDGKIDYKALKECNLSINMFLGLLRAKGYSKTEDLDYVVFEPQGKISAFPKSQKRPVQPSDMNIPTQYEGISVPVIMNGQIMRDCLTVVEKDEKWLKDQLQKQNVTSVKSVLLALLDSSGNLNVTQKNK